MNLTFAPIYQNADNPDRVFKIGKFRELNIYGAQIHDLTGAASGDEALLGGSDILLMGLTEDEYMLKDSDPATLKTLIDEFIEKLPKDRLLSFSQTNYKGEAVQKEALPRCDSMDDGKYTAYTQSMAIYIPDDISVAVNADYYLAANYYNRAMAIPEDKRTDETNSKTKQLKNIVLKKLKPMNEFFCVFNKSIGDRYPTIGPNGAVWVFTMEALAKNIIEKNTEIDLDYKKLDSKEFIELINHMYRFGMTHIVFNPGFDFAFTIERDAYMPIIGCEGNSIQNSQLHYLMIRFLQNKNINIENCQKAANVIWNAVNQNLASALLLVPMFFAEDKGKATNDLKLYYSKEAYEIAKDSKINFFGMAKFDTTPEKCEKPMQYLTLMSKDKDGNELTWLPAFTDIAELSAIFGMNTRTGVITFKELMTIAPKMKGICINPAGINLRLETQKKEESKTSEENTAKENNQTEEEIPIQENASDETPDSSTVEETVEEVSEEISEESTEKKSIFKKLFGKKD